MTSKTIISRKTGRNITIAYVTPYIHFEIGLELFRGITYACSERDVNLICICGKRLKDSSGFYTQANIAYELPSPDIFDGIITWISGFGHNIISKDIDNMIERFKMLPIINIGMPFEGISSVMIDDNLGIKELVKHLVEIHGLKKLAFIRGPEEHYYASRRFDAYKEALIDHNIPFNPDMVSPPGPFEVGHGQGSVIYFLENKRLRIGSDIEAVICMSDMFAMGAVIEFQKWGIKVPGDIAVVGFNNKDESRNVSPYITTVDPFFQNLGVKAVDMIISKINGEKIEEKNFTPVKMIIRHSCGCFEDSISHAGKIRYIKSGSFSDKQLKDKLLGEFIPIISEFEEKIMAVKEKIDPEWKNRLLDFFLKDLEDGKGDNFISYFEFILNSLKHTAENLSNWNELISDLRCSFSGFISDENLLKRAENIWHKSRVMISQIITYFLSQMKSKVEYQFLMLNKINDSLITTFELKGLISIIQRELQNIKINGCYLSLYTNPDESIDNAELIMAYFDNKNLMRYDQKYIYNSRDLIPIEFIPGNKRITLILEPLYYRDIQLGFIILEFNKPESYSFDASIYESIRSEISSALYNVKFFQELDNSKIEIENLFKQLQIANTDLKRISQAKSSFLASISHEIRTPMNTILGNNDYLIYCDENIFQLISDINEALIKAITGSESKKEFTGLLNFCLNYIKKIDGNQINIDHYYLSISEIVQDIVLNAGDTDECGEKGLVNKEILSLFQKLKNSIEKYNKTKSACLVNTAKSGNYLINLINSILDISKIEAGRVELVTKEVETGNFINELYNDSLSYLSKMKKDAFIKIKKKIEETVPDKIVIDYIKIKSIMLNLLSNAIKFTQKGEILISARVDAENLILSVKDTGIGMKKDEESLLFTDFGRSAEVLNIQGTGLGLSLSKRLIELHKGRIEAITEYGIGSEFCVILPINLVCPGQQHN